MFELTIHFKHKMIGIWQRFQWNFELSVPDLYFPYSSCYEYSAGFYLYSVLIVKTRIYCAEMFALYGPSLHPTRSRS